MFNLCRKLYKSEPGSTNISSNDSIRIYPASIYMVSKRRILAKVDWDTTGVAVATHLSPHVNI
jgi:hypothetical protein